MRRRSEISKLKEQARRAVLRQLGLSSEDSDRGSDSVARFTAAITGLGLDMAPYAALVRRDTRAPSFDPKKVRERERRNHLRSLGVDPTTATWYAQRGRMYERLVKRIESGSELTDAGPNP